MSNLPLIVSTSWLAERLEDPKIRIVDATTFLQLPNEGKHKVWSGRDAYEENHIPGAVFADILHDLSDTNSPFNFTLPSRDKFIEKITELGIGDPDTYVVIYDQGALVNRPVVAPHWATRLAWQLKYEGFEEIAILDGGLQKWIADGYKTTSEPGSYPKATFSGERNEHLFVSKEEVFEAIDDKNTIIINSLDEQTFTGEVNTYGRPGHIPNSVNVFFGLHSDIETKELHNDEKLRETFNKIGALNPNKKVITYCGGGIAATWNAILLNKLGQHNVAVYDGSMAEWASDPELPLHTSK